MEGILPPARGVSSIGSTVGDAVVPVAESPPNLPLQAALVNDLCSVFYGRGKEAKWRRKHRGSMERTARPTSKRRENHLCVGACAAGDRRYSCSSLST